jgi:hypothetical protein
MHFLIVLALIGCFVMFPGFRKVIATFLVLAAIGFTIIYGPLFLFGAMTKGQDKFGYWLLFVVIAFIVFYAFVYGKSSEPTKLNSDFNDARTTLAIPIAQTEIDTSSWNQAIDEFEGEARNRGLYAKLFAETQGDESKVKAKYIEIRAKEFQASKIPVTPETIKLGGDSINASISQESTPNSVEEKNKEAEQLWHQIFKWGGIAIFIIFIVRKVFF